MNNLKSYTVLELGKGNVITLNRYASNPKGQDDLIGSPKVIITLPPMFSTERALMARSLSDWSGSIQDIDMLKHLISVEFNKIRRTFLRDIVKAEKLDLRSQVRARNVIEDGKTVTRYRYGDTSFIEEFPRPSVEVKTIPVSPENGRIATGPKGPSK